VRAARKVAGRATVGPEAAEAMLRCGHMVRRFRPSIAVADVTFGIAPGAGGTGGPLGADAGAGAPPGLQGAPR
jgi:hypothetical protein